MVNDVANNQDSNNYLDSFNNLFEGFYHECWVYAVLKAHDRFIILTEDLVLYLYNILLI